MELLLKNRSILFGQRREDDVPVLRGVMAVKSQPVLLLLFPSLEYLVRNRVVGAKSDEDHRPGLRPVRPEIPVDERLGVGIEEFTEQ